MDNLDDLEMDMMSHRHDSDQPMSYLYEHDGGYRGAVRRCPGNGGRVACKHCGNNRLRWKFTVNGWRTFEGGVLHKCPAFSGKVKISPANADVGGPTENTTNMSKSFLDMTPEERAKKSKLTPKEDAAVAAFLAAAKNLPPTICVEVDDNWDGEGHLRISKRTSRGSCMQVATLHKKSLHF